METCLTPQQSQVAADHFYLVHDTVERFQKRYEFGDPDELESACSDELMECITDGKYNSDAGTFANYVSIRMWQRCLNVRRDAAVHARLLEKHGYKLHRDTYEDDHETRELRELVSKLPYAHVDLLIDYYWLDKSVKDIARATGSYHDAVMRKLNSALSKLRQYYGVMFA